MRPLSRVVADFAAGFMLFGAACHTHGQGAVGPLLTTEVVGSGATTGASRGCSRPGVPWLTPAFAQIQTADAPTIRESLRVELRVGGLVVFGDGAPAGTAPFADLRTVTRLSTSPRPWRLTTQTQLSAAPGSEFDVASADTWQTLDFALGLAVPLKSAWSVSGYATCGVQARVFRDDAIDPPAARRCGAGILVESTSAAHLSLILAYDERLHGWGALVGASVDVAPALGFVGSALVGRSSVTLKLAAVVRWARKR